MSIKIHILSVHVRRAVIFSKMLVVTRLMCQGVYDKEANTVNRLKSNIKPILLLNAV